MVMYRSHFENSFSVCYFEISGFELCTSIVSQTYTIPMAKVQRHLIAYPSTLATSSWEKANLVSPINVFAGFQFHTRKPSIFPPSKAAAIRKSVNLCIDGHLTTKYCNGYGYGRTQPSISSVIDWIYTTVNDEYAYKPKANCTETMAHIYFPTKGIYHQVLWESQSVAR